MINVPAATPGFLFKPASGRDVHFTADDWLNPFITGRLIKIDGAIEHTVVCKCERRQLQFVRFFHEPIQSAGAIEQRILAVQMEMNKLGVRHRRNLMAGFRRSKPRGEIYGVQLSNF
jgi:hypothetical protein